VTFRHFIATDPAGLPATALSGFEVRSLYPIWGGRLRGERKICEIEPGLKIEDSQLRAGVMRTDVVVRPGVLVLGVAHADMRLFGVPIRKGFLAAGIEGTRASAIAFPPTSFLCFVFEPEFAARVLDDERRAALVASRRPFGGRGIIRFMNPTGEILFRHAREMMADAEASAAGESGTPLACPLRADEAVEMSAECIDEMLRDRREVVSEETPARRLQIAQDVEAMLWRGPPSDANAPVSVDEAARALGCSRRSVQLAVNETFGVGFVALKRTIRLYQTYAVLKEGVHFGEIARIARAYEFNHLGRFSQYYREFFGELPSGRADQPELGARDGA
jgi:AraC-like DNA-binding protein